jgi:predicted DNA-binding transcriptional regulator AlpA
MTKPLTARDLQALAVELKEWRELREFFTTDALKALDPNQILPFKTWVKLAGISAATGWRMLHSGDGPKWIRIGEKRIGIRVRDHIAWADKLAKAS